MKKKWKLIIGGVIGIIVIIMTVLQVTKPLEAELLTITKKDIAKTFKEEGIVRAEKEFHIQSAYGGKITSLLVQEGDKVKPGDQLVAIDNQELQYQIQSLQGQMRSIEAQKDLQELTIDIETQKILYDAGVISKKEYDEANNTISSDYYPALIAAVRAQISQLNYQAAQRNSTAPVGGIVANITVKEGMVVLPGTPLLEIISGDALLVETHILTKDASRIKNAMEVRLIQENKSGDIVFTGKAERVAPSAIEKVSALGLIEQRLKVTIIPDLPSDLVLKPGYALTVEFTIDQQHDQLVVPKTAVFPYNNAEAVWIVKNGKAAIQPIRRGFENDRDTAVIEGLAEGDLVILNPKITGLDEGKRIKAL